MPSPIYKSIFGDASDNVPALKSKLGESEVVAILAEIDSNEKATLFYNSVVKRVTNVFESDTLNALFKLNNHVTCRVLKKLGCSFPLILLCTLENLI